ncbi:hypothetical protein BAUCODRAFT_131592 [Baudoinia panamericana UAMH 10762]|uniref:Galactose oxidase n=1 Tax=Baudoinia panamericana (strain UAMH 10762) TaxID=717646 RepID=M2MW81_BAUPA|nr:uncharacterized protein BAUCODRAFT_131592 [Baudoinia panamericana UAMH 10762]EMC95808.1 hypothetical protein BAUCODRAFT_131592 [Baudoinia panamericana UAMH 10762]
MAEVAATALAAEEAVTWSAQAGIAAYMVAQPTMPLKATFAQIATSSNDSTGLSLTRSEHSVSVVGNKAYVFGGETASGKLASADIHAVTLASRDKPEPDYSVVPAISDTEGGAVPRARKRHAACSFNVCVAVFGGLDESENIIDDGTLWLFNTAKSTWEALKPSNPAEAPQARSGACLFSVLNNLVLYGGTGSRGEALKDVWHFDYTQMLWTRLPDAPVSTTSAALTNGILHIVSSTSNVSSNLYLLPLSGTQEKLTWHTVPFPTNPLTPGPRPRTGAGLLPIHTGYGRTFLLYFFGARQIVNGEPSDASAPSPPTDVADSQPQYWSDIWTYQLPSVSAEPKTTAGSIVEAVRPANIKDKIRNALGLDSGGHSWAEVEVAPPTDMDALSGKVHPGPRGFFACDVMEDGKSVFMWGGVNAKGEREGDGWIVQLA